MPTSLSHVSLAQAKPERAHVVMTGHYRVIRLLLRRMSSGRQIYAIYHDRCAWLDGHVIRRICLFKFIAENIFALDPDDKTPAHECEEGVDFVTTNKFVLWGYLRLAWLSCYSRPRMPGPSN
ncbi:MAG: hypothetical protein ACI9SB_001995 [Candidatus Azotimanducaceae bacterium]|jgi:hypothetical protein